MFLHDALKELNEKKTQILIPCSILLRQSLFAAAHWDTPLHCATITHAFRIKRDVVIKT
jgi:hypothetical protein